MHTGPDQGQIGPLLACSAVNFLSGTVCADFLVLPDSRSFCSHFSAANYKTTKFSFKILCRCAELPAKRMDSVRGAPGYWLRPVLSTRDEQLIPADDRKEETTLPYSFSPQRQASFPGTYTIWLRFEGELKLIEACAQKCHKILRMCVVLRVSSPKRKRRLYLAFCHPFISGKLTRCWKHRIEKHDVNDEKEMSRKQSRGKSLSGWHT